VAHVSYIIDAIYRTMEIPEKENPRLRSILGDLSLKSGIKKPRLMLARIPNAVDSSFKIDGLNNKLSL